MKDRDRKTLYEHIQWMCQYFSQPRGDGPGQRTNNYADETYSFNERDPASIDIIGDEMALVILDKNTGFKAITLCICLRGKWQNKFLTYGDALALARVPEGLRAVENHNLQLSWELERMKREAAIEARQPVTTATSAPF